jgi:hypothetical protein
VILSAYGVPASPNLITNSISQHFSLLGDLTKKVVSKWLGSKRSNTSIGSGNGFEGKVALACTKFKIAIPTPNQILTVAVDNYRNIRAD